MSIEQRRQDALADLRGLLAGGVEPDDAVREAAKTHDFPLHVMQSIGQALIGQRDRLIEAERIAEGRRLRSHKVEGILQSYRLRLQDHPDTDIMDYLSIQDRSGLSADDDDQLFFKGLDAWLDRNV